jgi:hypothetical protein
MYRTRKSGTPPTPGDAHHPVCMAYLTVRGWCACVCAQPAAMLGGVRRCTAGLYTLSLLCMARHMDCSVYFSGLCLCKGEATIGPDWSAHTKHMGDYCRGGDCSQHTEYREGVYLTGRVFTSQGLANLERLDLRYNRRLSSLSEPAIRSASIINTQHAIRHATIKSPPGSWVIADTYRAIRYTSNSQS